MKRLTNEEVRVDESVDRYLGPLADLEGMKPKLLDLILNGPVLNGVSKDVLRQIIRQLYSALAAYEDTGMTPESVEALKLSMMGKAIAEIKEFNGLPVDRLRELAEAKQRHDDALGEAAHLKGQLKVEEGRAARKDELLDEALHRLEVEKAIAEDYHESLKWCMAHPWRNMWRCMKEYFRF